MWRSLPRSVGLTLRLSLGRALAQSDAVAVNIMQTGSDFGIK